jgi:hypothetical protein
LVTRGDEVWLREAIIYPLLEYGRYGYRRITGMLSVGRA